MSAPIRARLFPKRMFFAILRSNSVTRSPYSSLLLSRLTICVVVFRVAPRQPTPLVATEHGSVARDALPAFQMIASLLYVMFALRSTPGNDWYTVETSTSTHGIV